MLLTIGLAVMCIGVAFGVIGIALPRASAPRPFTTFLHYAVMAGIFAIGSTVMYVVNRYDGARLALAVGDATMVISAGTLAVALGGLPARRRRGALGLIVATAVALGACTAVTDEDLSLIIKAAILAVVCGVCALAALQSPVAPRPTALLVAAAMGLYAVYCTARTLVGVTTGWTGPVGAAFRSLEVGAAVAIAAVLVCGVGVILSLRSPTRVADGQSREHSVVVIDDAHLVASAFGPDRLRALVNELRTAAHALDDRAVDVRHGVATALPSALPTLARQMHDSFGWSPEEIALLTEGDAPHSRAKRR